MSWDHEAREAIARDLYLQQARRHVHPDDVETPEERWDREGLLPNVREAWLTKADHVLTVLAPVVAREVARAKAEALREFGPWVQQENACDPEDECPEGTCRLCDLLLAVYSDANDRADAIEAEAGGS